MALPREICGASLDALFDYIVTMADRVGAVHDGQDDLRFLENLVAVGVVLAPHTRHPYDDLLLLRVSAGKSVSAARMQRGRDWAEHALNMVNGDTLRARVAWFAFADVYFSASAGEGTRPDSESGECSFLRRKSLLSTTHRATTRVSPAICFDRS